MPEIEPDTRGDRRCRLFRSLAPDPTSHTTHPPGSGSGPGRWSYHLESTKAPAPCPPPPRPAQQSTVWHSPKGAEIQWRLSQGSRTGSRSRSTRRQRSRASPRPGPSITYLEQRRPQQASETRKGKKTLPGTGKGHRRKEKGKKKDDARRRVRSAAATGTRYLRYVPTQGGNLPRVHSSVGPRTTYPPEASSRKEAPWRHQRFSPLASCNSHPVGEAGAG